MDANELSHLFNPIFAKIINLAELDNKPLLAHYTSLGTLEKVVKSGNLLFSNPLFMNDTQEFGFKMVEGYNLIHQIFEEPSFKSAVGDERILIILNSFRAQYVNYEQQHAIDLFIFCFSEHAPANTDGLLSMWRAYGGNGSGAALVINSDFITIQPESPLLIAKVDYKSDGDRRMWLRSIISETQKILLSNPLTDELLLHYADYLFQILKIYSVISKHHGFIEEREWRIIYFPERDTHHLLSDQRTYVVGKNGIEPKLEFPIKPLGFETPAAWTFESITDRIILGPMQSSVLATQAVKKMFEALDRKAIADGLPAKHFAQKVIASSIPYRGT